MESQKKKTENEWQNRIFRSEDFPKLIKHQSVYSQNSENTEEDKQKMNKANHIIVKLLKTNDKDKILKSYQEKRNSKNIADFSSQMVDTKRRLSILEFVT